MSQQPTQTLAGRGLLDLVTLTQPRSPAAEAYRALRTNLIFSSLDRPLATLLVTSAAPDEGKSTTLANLAVTIAQGGRRTVVVDCDLRRPTQHTLWGLSAGGRGLTSMVLESDGLSNPPLTNVGIENLSVLPSGPLPPNPADLLGSRRMEEIVAALKARADMVLFDAPPVLAVTDAALLASKLDGVLLVVEAGGTRREHAQRAKELLEKLNIRIVGVVLNNAPVDSSMGVYYSST
jgi:non-specific protein-tyrosine kinase